ncbi:glycerol-3-phosphate acyltransferase 1, mitochondrial-like [Saccostrea cucullata]|uniref:glycerol-3-phosphate acyltransferase 1, mitochondrial-like n=1 Tax=Saccostrea cuccullata TaxID=36930 RepID=UPI002ED43725
MTSPNAKDPLTPNMQAVFAKWEGHGPRMREGDARSENKIKWDQVGQLADKITQEGRAKWRERYGDSIQPASHRRARQRNRRPAALATEEVTNNAIAEFKSKPLITAETLLVTRPYMGNVCSCMPNSQVDFSTVEAVKMGFRNILDLEMRGRNWKEKYFANIVYAVRRRTKYVYPDVSSSVLTHPRVKEAIIQEDAEITDDKKRISSEKRAQRIFDVMKSTITGKLAGIVAWILTKVFPSILRAILVHKGQIDVVKKASERGVPMIYLPLHRSHLDYVLMTFIFWHYKIQSPYVAAGINLNIPIFGPFMKSLGGFFIRRKLDKSNGKKDMLYRSILHIYIEELLRNGQSMEFFLEGGRSRSGKSYPPKGGLLSVIQGTLSSGHVEDVYIVPVSINYEKLMDGNFSTEQLGLAKKPETFLGAVRALLKVCRTQYGSVRVDFCKPLSLKEYLQNTQSCQSSVQGSEPNSEGELSADSDLSPSPVIRRQGSVSSLYGSDIGNDNRQIVQDLAEHITYTSTNSTALMSTNLLAFLLLKKHRQGVQKSQLALDLEWLVSELKVRQRDVGFTGESEAVVQSASLLLGNHLVTRTMEPDSNVEFYKASSELSALVELSYYSNAVLSVFLLESVISCAIIYCCDVSLDNTAGHVTSSATREEVIEVAVEICQLLQYEFIFVSPCKQLEEALEDELDQMISMEVVQVKEMLCDDQYSMYEKGWAQRLSKNMAWRDEEEDDEENFIFQQTCQVNTNRADCMEKLKFYHQILAPFLESYYVTACQISKCLHTQFLESEFIHLIHSEAKRRVHEKLASNEESVVLDSLKNSVKSFSDMKIIDIYCVGNLRMVELHDHFEVKEKLNKYVDLLETLKG